MLTVCAPHDDTAYAVENIMFPATCEMTACDTHKARTACCHSRGVTVDADGPSSSPPRCEVCDIESAGSVGSKAGACDVEDIEAGSIDGPPTLPQGGVWGGACDQHM